MESFENINCKNCTLIKEPVSFACYVCQRSLAYYKCPNCDDISTLLDVCSPKCRQILNGEAHIIPIEYNHQTVIIIEDFNEIMGLKVVNHTLLQQVLTEKQKDSINKLCNKCHEHNLSLLPYKCWLCKESYTYEVECSKCYNDKEYLCDECEYDIVN